MPKLSELPDYRGLAERSQRLADGAMDERTAMALHSTARDYETLADELEKQESPRQSKN
jgi:hypothetical protein